MYKIFNFFKSFKFLKITSVIFLVIYVFLIFFYKNKIGVSFNNNDNYLGVFKSFLELGYYQSVVKGTSILYNLVLEFVFYYVGNIETSFILINTFSHLFLIGYGYYLLKKISIKQDVYFYITVGFYMLYEINNNYFASASNDTFLAVFTLLLFNQLIFKIYKDNYQYYSFFLIGLLLSICFAIRPTAFFLIPITILCLIIWFKKKTYRFYNKIFKVIISFIVFIFFTVCLHYPSIKENNSLSFYDKRPENISENWVQRNYLGLKKIEKGELTMNRDAIWIHTKFHNVKEYLDVNGEDSLPSSFLEFLNKDPILLVKITTYNIIYSFFRFFRFWGVLLIFLILPYIKCNKQTFILTPILSSSIFISAVLMISFVCLTFIEERWFIAYEILIPMSILSYLRYTILDKKKLNMIFSFSLIFVSLMNLRSIFSYL